MARHSSCYLLQLLASCQLLTAAAAASSWCYPAHGVDYCTTTKTSILVTFNIAGGSTVCVDGLRGCAEYSSIDFNYIKDGETCRTACANVSNLLCSAFTYKKVPGTEKAACYLLDACDSPADPDDQSAACTPNQACVSSWKCDRPTTDCSTSAPGVNFDGTRLNARHWSCVDRAGRPALCDIYARNKSCAHGTSCRLSTCQGQQEERMTCSNGDWLPDRSESSWTDLPCPCPILQVKEQPGHLQLACSPAPPTLNGTVYEVEEGSCVLVCGGRLERHLACSLVSARQTALWIDEDENPGPFECSP